MQIGVPKESIFCETRVALVPALVKKLITQGYRITVEANAGVAAGFADAAYQEAGASIGTHEAAMAADLVLKVRKPCEDDALLMKPGSSLISFIETCEDDEVVHGLQAKDIHIFAMERMPRTSRAQSMDALSSQANIAGYRTVIEAAAHYGRFMPLMMTSAGSAKPARLVVLGVGVAGLQAIATARRLGADVYAYDIRSETREQIQSLGAKPIDLDIGESGSGEGGYAKELSEEAKQRQQKALADELSKAHIIISTAAIPCRPAPRLISEEVVKNMRDGSVIIDMAAATGGNCPLTEADKVVVKHGVTLVGHTDYPSMVPSDASTFYAHNVTNLLAVLLESVDGKPTFKPFDEDDITQAVLMPKLAGED